MIRTSNGTVFHAERKQDFAHMKQQMSAFQNVHGKYNTIYKILFLLNVDRDNLIPQ
jgi:hypothetical protein